MLTDLLVLCFTLIAVVQSYRVQTRGSDQVNWLGCFVCSSVNGSEPDCHDEFNAREDFYQPNCMSARKSYDSGLQETSDVRAGLYPATSCIKFKAVDEETGEEHIVRGCATEGGGTTHDTEIGGISHCGLLMRKMVYNNRPMMGCIVTCKQNGCNTAISTIPTKILLFIAGILCIMLKYSK